MEARDATLKLLGERKAGATVCPSEVARAIAPLQWREAMPAVHSAIDLLLSEGIVALSWKGEVRTERDGPYRIGLRSAGKLP